MASGIFMIYLHIYLLSVHHPSSLCIISILSNSYYFIIYPSIVHLHIFFHLLITSNHLPIIYPSTCLSPFCPPAASLLLVTCSHPDSLTLSSCICPVILFLSEQMHMLPFRVSEKNNPQRDVLMYHTCLYSRKYLSADSVWGLSISTGLLPAPMHVGCCISQLISGVGPRSQNQCPPQESRLGGFVRPPCIYICMPALWEASLNLPRRDYSDLASLFWGYIWRCLGFTPAPVTRSHSCWVQATLL